LTDLPVPRETAVVTLTDGTEILLRRLGDPAKPRLALSHGNGLAIDGYWPFWRLLLARYDLVMFDQRNHGRNAVHLDRRHDWDILSEDIVAIAAGITAAFGKKTTTALVHSASSIASLRAMLHDQFPWDAVVLFDPPFYPPPDHPLLPQAEREWLSLVMRSRRRPERYDDPSGLAAQFRRSTYMTRWVPEAFDVMARATLRPDPARGDWTLACPREFEARLFETNRDPIYVEKIASVRGAPFCVIGADPDKPDAEIPPLINKWLADRIDYRPIKDTTHFLQVEKPAACVAAVEDFLRQHKLA
jgi:pimeloyl-ACP methyl ester carboxylesterase